MGLSPVSQWEIRMQQKLQWIHDLLTYVTFKHIDIVIEELELENNHHLLMVLLDGSGKDNAMTFGWVLRNVPKLKFVMKPWGLRESKYKYSVKGDIW